MKFCDSDTVFRTDGADIDSALMVYEHMRVEAGTNHDWLTLGWVGIYGRLTQVIRCAACRAALPPSAMALR